MAVVQVTNDSLSKVLRSLSQKRCSGELFISSELQDMKVTLNQGKIVGAANSRDDTAAHICQRLLNAECIGIEVLEELTASELSLLQLLQWLTERGYVTEEQFARARRGYELDLLHSLREFESGTADFKQKSIPEEDEHCLSVYPAQLLLDIEDLKENEERFAELFNSDNASNVIQSVAEPYDGLNEEELLILEIVDGGVSPSAMIQSSMLSRYHVIESALSLYDQSMIAIADTEEIRRLAVESAGDGESGEMAEFDTSPSEFESFRSMGSGSGSPEEFMEATSLDAMPMFDGESADSLDGLEISGFQTEAPGVPTMLGVGNPEDLAREAAKYFESFGAAAAGGESEGENAESSTQDAIDSEQGSKYPSYGGGLQGHVRSLNYYLSDPSIEKNMLVVVTLVFLAVFAQVAPEFVELWFARLSEFTS